MRENLTDIVHAILRRVVSLRERLEIGEEVQLEFERKALQESLALLATEEAWDDAEDGELSIDFHRDHQEDHARLSQATIRFALTCWIDEFLAQYSPLGQRWSACSLGTVLYGERDSGEKFWEEARYAEVRGDFDALDALYWCVLLGYRGAWRDKPARIEAWGSRVRALLARPAGSEEPAPLERDLLAPQAAPPSDLAYRRMLFTVSLTLSFLVPVGLLLYWRHPL